MDDFLAKPYRIGDLDAMLERRLSAPPRSPSDLTATGAPPSPGGPLATIRQLESSGGKDLLEQMTEIFTTQGRHDLETMRQALTQGDADRLARRAHRLGGSADHLGGTVLSALCAEVEELAQDGDLVGCQPRLQAVEEEFHRIVDELVGATEGERGEMPKDAR